MGPILHLALKDLRLLVRDRLGFFWMLGLPLIFGLFFGSIFGDSGPSGSRRLNVVAVSPPDGISPGAAAFFERLGDSDAIELTWLPRAEAEQRVRLGKQVAYIDVLSAPDSGGFDMFGAGTGAVVPRLEVGIDPSRRAEAGYLRGLVMEASFASIAEMFADPARMATRAREALGEVRAAPGGMAPGQRLLLEGFLSSLAVFLDSVDADAAPRGFGMSGDNVSFTPVARQRVGPQNAYEVSFPSAIMWGLMSCASAFAMTLVRERRDGTLLRLLTAPLTRAQVLLGKALACFSACCLVVVLLIGLATIVFGIRLTNPAGLAMAVVASSTCFVGLMMFLSVLGKTEQAASGAGWGLFIVMAMLGGSMVPLIAMPSWMLTLSNFSPVKWAIYSLEGAIWRGFSVGEMLVPCGILVAIGVGGFALGRSILARRE